MTLRTKLIALAYRCNQHEVATDLLNLAEQVGNAEVREAKAMYVRHRPVTATVQGGRVAKVVQTLDEDDAKAAMLCCHANEIPEKCSCEGMCYCRRPGGPCDLSW